ncbi:hypothetical protein N8I77_011937 [Diaporthe amygdali]|uniref:Uncharacterized protein n=1 Tax=Phomopsis amygdali TaxID=1214568 RepID=A0AAD9VXX5_PHOAM|nr:hypothetical protein N8I77_011937 [Diaporthe amygdali]
MTEQDASPQHLVLPRPHGHRTTSRDRHAAPASPETGESSHSGSIMNSTWTTDATLAQQPSHDDAPGNGQAGGQQRAGDVAREHKRQSRQSRPHKPRSSGAFLLSDPFDDTVVDDTRAHRHRSRRTVEKGKGKSQRTSTRHSDEHIQNGRHSGLGLGLSPGPERLGYGSAERPPGTSPGALGSDLRQDQAQAGPRAPSPRSSTSSLDMDSTQIVNMALNLSESRRMVQRRNLSQPLPPRLVPLPTDSAVAGSLRQQLQQQRRVSRTMSPKPERGAPSRLGSSGKVSSLQPAFDPLNDGGSYRYHFSSSTMARAQKAKDYMELLAQYRRALELLPPLKPNTLSKASTASDYPLSASASVNPLNFDTASQIGRSYDPLQYIRNRKVRARERKTIDGESQGFGDVSRVTDWVDDVAKWVATRQMRTPGSSALPPFAGADVITVETSPPSHVSRPSNAIAKPKRPRNDWTIDPADLVADIYWLEQDDHKRLVEDRNWRRVFPQDAGLYRPLSQATNDGSPAFASKTAQLQLPGAEDGTGRSAAEAKAAKADHDHASGGTRERARQKLQELRSFHRHTNSSHNHSHNPLRRRDSSSSSSSDSDSQKKRSRKNTIDIDKDILEKQMMEMIAREAQENGAKLTQEPELKELKSLPSNLISPDRLENSDSTGGSRLHSRRESLINVGGFEDKDHVERPKITSSQRPSRESLEVPPLWGRPSLESESSLPNSPEARPSRRDNYFMPGIGADLSPSSSRTGSPSRNPFSKVRQMFRDRSRERASERPHEIHSSEKEDGIEVIATTADRLSSTPELVDKRGRSRSRNGSVGPEPKITSRPTGDSQKSHRKTNSMRLGDPGASLRSLFKGPRIDSVLKSGVSKVSELLWKKESEAEDSDSSTSSSDGTDAEDRGRLKQGKSLSPSASIRGRPGHVKQESKHFLDVMPPFVSTSDTRDSGGRHASLGVPLSRPSSRRSTRFELLKPPRIDISVADSSTDTQKDAGVDVSDTEVLMSNIREEPMFGSRRPSTALSVQSPKTRRFSSAFNRDSRHFSISDQTSAPERAPLTRREVARVRALMLSSGVMAMNISRRAHQAQVLDASTINESNDVLSALGNRVSWPEITQLAPEEQRQELLRQPVSEADLFPVTARVLGTAIQTSRQRWESAAESFRHRTRNEVTGQIEQLRTRLQLDLSAMTRAAAEEADEVSGDLVDGQRRKVKAVVDVIDKLSRRRRRRFRWARRAGWLALEWALVGFMWYVWLVVMIARIFLGVGKGFVRGVRWLLWL